MITRARRGWWGGGAFAGLAALSYAAPAAADEPAPAQPPPAAAAAPAPAAPPDEGGHPAPNSIYAEGLGAAIGYSLNYERMVLDDLGVRVGFSYLSVSASSSDASSSSSSTNVSASFVFIPITASYTGLRTRGGVGLEAGGGATMLYTSASASALGASTSGSALLPYAVAMVGLRIHPIDHAGFQFRVGGMALGGEGLGLQNASPGSFGFIPWAYISVGASF